jgi:hypothetical protein
MGNRGDMRKLKNYYHVSYFLVKSIKDARHRNSLHFVTDTNKFDIIMIDAYDISWAEGCRMWGPSEFSYE